MLLYIEDQDLHRKGAKTQRERKGEQENGSVTVDLDRRVVMPSN
jgi:hypothetical protein